ncbi:hypothetical protein SPSIL_017000 [Sporomusa silvacetica DSM 10669]|uniref:Uncharacterized protein n=1 Tax=Sporomusa silvacetica DSM 10669 TaxID=1123289 RepID=A0ABZ3IIP3_9FIRM|nr:hypothetical protein [Sporomusa silvacetica]OZC18353.1 hypothetical protein SPSIL_25530 [Sporomusa silvacetica DSM 10669]
MYLHYIKKLVNLKLYATNYLVHSLIDDAICIDNHLLADKAIVLMDALQEVGIIDE